MRVTIPPMRVAVVQNAAGDSVPQTLARLESWLDTIGPSDLIVLPEVFALRGSHDDYRQAAELLGGPLTCWLADRARQLGSWLLGGSLIERGADGRLYNTAVLVDRAGHVRATYRKIHLFEATLDDGRVIREAEIYAHGDEPVLVVIEGWRSGLSICYDLRFPELYRRYAADGAELLLIPSNFTQNTGRAHWETLVRARAIENQCFVVAANQCGKNPATGVASYGHSLIVGPWGEILAEAGDEETVIVATLERPHLEQVRARVPVGRHRRLREIGKDPR